MNNNVLKISKIETSSLIDKQSGYDLIFLNDMLLNAEIGIYKNLKQQKGLGNMWVKIGRFLNTFLCKIYCTVVEFVMIMLI